MCIYRQSGGQHIPEPRTPAAWAILSNACEKQPHGKSDKQNLKAIAARLLRKEDIAGIYREQEGSDQGNPRPKKCLGQFISRWYRQDPCDSRKRSQDRFGRPQMDPRSQQQIVESHVGLARAEDLPKVPPTQGRNLQGYDLVGPQTISSDK